MNEFVEKKVGEVLAFMRNGSDVFDRGDEAVATLFGDTQTSEFVSVLGEFTDDITEFAEGNATILEKADATSDKLGGMSEAYIKDDWDDPAELGEWLSFYSGAGSAHAALVKGAAETIGEDALLGIMEEAIEFFDGMLEEVKDSLEQYGADRATE